MVQYTEVPYTSDGSHATYNNTFQIVLYEGTNDIQVNYLDVTTRGPGDDMAFAGIENRFGNQGLRYGPMSLAGRQYKNLYVRYYSPEGTVVEPPSKPNVISPRGSTAETKPAFSWNRVENASRYLLTVYGGGDVIHRSGYDAVETGSGTILSVRPSDLNLVDKGSYSWDVSALDAAGRAAVSDTVTFTVQVGSVPPVPPIDPAENSSAFLNNLYFPHVVSDGTRETEITIINTSAFRNLKGEIRSYNSLGKEVSDPLPINLIPLRKFQAKVGEFSSINSEKKLSFSPDQTDYLIFFGDSERMVGYSRTGEVGLYQASVPAILHRDASRGDLYIPHVISDGSWKNELILLNTESEEVTLTMEFAVSAPDPVLMELTLAGGEKKILDMEDLSSEPVFQNGSIYSAIFRQNPETSGAVAALALYEKGSQLAAVPLTDRKETELVYPHIPNHNWITGLVLFNVSEQEETITITAYDETGAQIDHPFDVAVPGQSKLLTTPKGPVFSLPDGTSWFSAVSPNGICGFELFGTSAQTRLAGLGVSGLESRRGIFPIVESPGKTGVTGICLVNPAEEPAWVSLKAFKIVTDDTGTKAWQSFAESEKEIPPRGKIIGQAEGFFDDEIAGAYYIRYESDKELVGFQVNTSADGASLDAIPALGGDLLYDELFVTISSSISAYGGDFSTTLTGMIEDPGGFSLDGDISLSYNWFSSLGGSLGTGRTLELGRLNLSSGEHRITLEVVDTESGARGSASILYEAGASPM